MPTPPTKISTIITSNETHIILEARTQNGQRLEVVERGDDAVQKVGALILEFTKARQPLQPLEPTPTPAPPSA